MTRDDHPASAGPVSVVVITRNRCAGLMATLERLVELPDAAEVVVVDNGSSDGTADAVRWQFPGVVLVALAHNLGAAARTVGVHRTRTPYVAFSDDDSWWAPGSLSCAAAVLDRCPRLAVVAARVLVGPDGRLDPVCRLMRDSPLSLVPGAGPRVLGFVACGAVVRRSAYLDAGGFHPRLGIGSEEGLLALDLADRGWVCAYVDSVVAHHEPSPSRDPDGRRASQVRNDLWTLWLRRRRPAAIRGTARVVRAAVLDRAARTGLRQALRGAGWVLQARAAVSRTTERDAGLLQQEHL